MQVRCPELLITNYSMLEYMLMRPIERDIFEQTKDWLKSDVRNEFILVLDEAHRSCPRKWCNSSWLWPLSLPFS